MTTTFTVPHGVAHPTSKTQTVRGVVCTIARAALKVPLTSPACSVRMSKGQSGAPPNEGKNSRADPCRGEEQEASHVRAVWVGQVDIDGNAKERADGLVKNIDVGGQSDSLRCCPFWGSQFDQYGCCWIAIYVRPFTPLACYLKRSR